ncbi:TPA: YSIRK-type signal peptide-containing protein, partial [Staphylococcus aureus]|nr:YSIRK-type signal peptide-containing protein [Staphylococcus aureus]HAZ5316848.1 YSIRK-type signal peptide-containing protein [Staphylococcus aureus]HCZ9408416.1 carboxypeptidase regulatory-like domain-containing protein [Staphylococcus aureus]
MKNLNSKCGRTLSRFSIRKCSVGTASFLIGTVAFFGIHHEAFAAENSKTPVPVTQLLENSNKESTEEKTDLQTNENETLQGGVSNNTLNREVEKENVNGIQEKPNAQKEEKTLSDSQLTRSSQQDNSTTTASPQTNDHQLPIKHDTSYEKSTSNSTLNEQPMEPTPFPNNTVKTEEVGATQNAATVPLQLQTVKGTKQLRAVNTAAVTPAVSGGTNVNDKVTASNMDISESYIEPNNSGSFYLNSRFTVNGTVKEGDYFTVKMPNAVNTYGDTRYYSDFREELKNSNGDVIALGEYDVASHTLTYKFTSTVNNLQNVTGSFNLTQFMDRQVAKTSDTYPLKYEIAGESFNTQIKVHYGQYHHIGDSNLKSMITMEDSKTGEYEQYIYVNPLKKDAYGTVVRVKGFSNNLSDSNGQVNPDTTQIKILKVDEKQDLNDSFGVDDSQYEDVTNQFKTVYDENNLADIHFGDLHGARYIIKVTSKEKEDSSADLKLSSSMYTKNRYGQYDRITWDNHIVKSSSSGNADGTEVSYQLGDKVWNDANKNGIQDAGEFGIPGVKVILKDKDGNFLEKTETNANGKYVFDNLSNGIYTVDFEAPEGYTASPQNQGNDALDSDGPTSAHAIISDGNNLTIDQGFYLTEPPVPTTHNIGDKVWEDLNKDGIQDDNEPGISNVKVTLTDSDGNVVDTRKTDDKGNYLFEDVKAGDYIVTFETPEGFTPTQTGQGTIDNDSNGTSTKVTVGDSDDLSLDSGFYKTPKYNLGNYVWEDTNKDGKQDSTEKGISGVTVTLKNENGEVLQTTKTDKDGKYQFTDLNNGTYKVEFETPSGYTPTSVTSGNDTEKDSNGLTTTGVIKDADNMTLDSGFYKTPKYSLGDYVWYDSNKDGKQDSTEKGIKDVKVTLLNEKGEVIGTTKTDENGKYRFDNLDSGKYKVIFEKPAGLTQTG